jgi:RNA polymerase sigma-70 factor (ECF subfamily)
MNELSPDHRAVVDLTYFHGMGYREIAEVMSCPVDTVKTRMFHARRRLREAMSGGPADWL